VLTFGIFPNKRKERVGTILEWLIHYLQNDRQNKILMPTDAAVALGYPELACDRETLKNKIAIAISLGGDGTLLNTVREVADAGVPVCGVNMGQLGFLAEIETAKLSADMDRIINGDYFVEERLMLSTIVKRQQEVVQVCPSINDVVISRSGFSRMLKLNVFIDNELTANYPADGLIVATSTGSTGYSLSAGGPIVNPKLKVIVLTPICPHIINSRSLIIAEDEEVKITLEAAHKDIALTVDGQSYVSLLPDDVIIVRKSSVRARFIRFYNKSYYQKLRNKLRRGDDQ
jgi:NAD+ kinase